MSLAGRLAAVRARTLALAARLSPEDCCVQSMPDASPVKWHLGHTTWFFETFVLEPHEPGFCARHPAWRVLFNSYYQGVGPMHPRAQRGLLTRPTLAAIIDWRHAVEARLELLLADPRSAARVARLVELGLQHEQQHQELLLTDVLHLFSCNPLLPAYASAEQRPADAAPPLEWISNEGGIIETGAPPDTAFCFDNELPRHVELLAPHALASRPVTSGEFLAFMEDGGYAQPALWMAEGWDWIKAQGISHPLYWQRSGQGWRHFGLHGLLPLDHHAPVCHVSWFEADAYARWADARLPGEAEWEHAASALPVNGHFADGNLLTPAGAPAGAGAFRQMYGDVWEWTASPYRAYPGYRPAPGAIGEYNGKFMVNQFVLRGGSCATPAGHLRASYRNFFPPTARWQFTGLRLARDL